MAATAADDLMSPLVRSVLCTHPGGLHRVAYREWLPASPDGRTVVCVHGLTRNGGDFDRLAQALAQEGCRVICPDLAGRGHSERLADASAYAVPQYVGDMLTLLARLDCDEVDWVGTSLGGLIGMTLASMPVSGKWPVRRLLLNDIGPVLSRAGLARIAAYVGDRGHYDDFASAEAALRERMASFGPHDDDEFRLLSRHYFVEDDSGWAAHYDPAIGDAFAEVPAEDVAFWPVWQTIACPVMVLRGELSDLLSSETAQAMTRGGPLGDGPRAELETISGVGHAPTLIRDEQVRLVSRFLAA